MQRDEEGKEEKKFDEVTIKYTNDGTDVHMHPISSFLERKGTTVRLTKRAHSLCSKKAEDYKTSMKAVASEAIFLLVQGEDRDQEIEAHRNHLNEASIKLQKRLPIHLFASAAVGTVVGIVLGALL